MSLGSQAERLSEGWMLAHNQNFSRNLSAYFWSTVIVLILVILLLRCNRAKRNTESQREGIVSRYMIHVKAMDVLQAQVS